MARVLRGFAPEPPVVFVILSEAKYHMLYTFGLTPHLNPLPKERKKNSNQPYGTQFHSTQLRFVGSASVLKERENAVGSASVPRRGGSVFQISSY